MIKNIKLFFKIISLESIFINLKACLTNDKITIKKQDFSSI